MSATFPNQPANGIHFWADVVFLTEAPALPVPTPLPVPTEVPDNSAPTRAASSDTVIVGEGQVAVMTGWVSDANGDVVALSAAIGTMLHNGDGTWAWTWSPSDGPAETQVVTISAADGRGGTAQTTFTVNVYNEAPQASLRVEPATISEGEAATIIFSGAIDISHVDTAAGYVYAFDCQADSSFEIYNSTSPESSCSFPSSGLYTVVGRVYDKDGAYSEYSANVTVNVAAASSPRRLNRAK